MTFIKYCGCRDEWDTPVLESILEQMSQLMRRVFNLAKEVRKNIPSRGTSVRPKSTVVCFEHCKWVQCDQRDRKLKRNTQKDETAKVAGIGLEGLPAPSWECS